MTLTIEHSETYTFGEDVVSILPIADLMNYESVDSDEINYESEIGDYTYGPVAGVLPWKREDDHFEALVEVLRSEGFVKPIRVHPSKRRITDGHHRLAAAIDLGLSFVPVATYAYCDDDSGDWGQECW